MGYEEIRGNRNGFIYREITGKTEGEGEPVETIETLDGSLVGVVPVIFFYVVFLLESPKAGVTEAGSGA
jgi:hypothetical protein